MPWSWKKSTDPNDVSNFLNGNGAYKNPVKNGKICALWKDANVEFYVFYIPGSPGQKSGNWGWKKSTDPDDVINFLNAQGGYINPVSDSRVCLIWKGACPEFYVFYNSSKQKLASKWGWKKSIDPDDVLKFLNGSSVYAHPVTTARIAATKKSTYSEYYVFYQKNVLGDPIPNWGWKKSTNPDDLVNFLNGQGQYKHPVQGSEIVALKKAKNIEFHIFHNKGTKIWVQNPVPNGRFVSSQSTQFTAIVTSESITDSSQLNWISSKDGPLGKGSTLQVNGISTGTHDISVTGYGQTEKIPIRVFSDLWELYQSFPAQGEIDRIMKEFSFNWNDGTAADEKWTQYDAFKFDQKSKDPAKIVAIAKLDVLKRQQFSEPLPFTDGKTIYDYLRSNTHTISLGLDCGGNSAGGGSISLDRNLSVWDLRSSGTATDPNACKKPFANASLGKYINPLQLIVHESRHNERSDPSHTTCPSWSNPRLSTPGGMDNTLEKGSGYAWAALYLMWVYKYGLYDPLQIKEEAKNIAISLLKGRFCNKPTHSNPKVQAILDELI
jgi:hypothetical protein